MEEISADNIIIGGDFNFVTDYSRDSNYCQQNNPRARDAFEKIVKLHNLVDTWRELNPDINDFTWFKPNPLKYGRLDRLYIQQHLISHVVTATIHAGYRSDHSIVCVAVKEPQKKKGPGLWKFNESLLNDEQYDDMVREVIANAVKQYAVPIYNDAFLCNPNNFDAIQFTISLCLFYETLLMTIRGETVRFSKQKARKRRKDEFEMISEISKLKDLFNISRTQENLMRLEEAQRKLEHIRKPYIQGLITRSRVKWHEDGEKCSKYFLSLEKRNATRKSIQSLKANGRVITSKKEILQTFSENLRTKYCKDTTTVNAKEYVRKNVRRKLSNMQKHALDAPLSLSELHMALMKMKKGKSPGTNGFTSDFFRHFWDVLGVFLFRACKEGLQNKTLINSHRESVVTLIPKQGKPHDSIKGWRPISLLNVDFKIISSAIANRQLCVI